MHLRLFLLPSMFTVCIAVLCSADCTLVRVKCLVLARYKMSKGETRNMATIRELGKASYVASVVGIVVAVIIIFVVLIAVSRQLVN